MHMDMDMGAYPDIQYTGRSQLISFCSGVVYCVSVKIKILRSIELELDARSAAVA